MPGHITVASDNFVRANAGTLGGNWSIALGSYAINTNRAEGVDSGYNDAVWTANAFANDQYSTYIVATGSTAYLGPIVRFNAGSNSGYFGLYGPGGDNYIVKRVSGSDTNLATNGSGTAYATGDTLELDVVGNTLTFKRNGTTLLTYTDSSSPITSGSAGITGSSAGGTYCSYWEGGNLGSTGVPGLLMMLGTG